MESLQSVVRVMKRMRIGHACRRREMRSGFGWGSLGHALYCLIKESSLYRYCSLKMRNFVINIRFEPLTRAKIEVYLLRAHSLDLSSFRTSRTVFILYPEDKACSLLRTVGI